MARLRLRDPVSHLDTAPRPVRVLLPIALGGFAALGHESWGVGGWPALVALAFALSILPSAPRRAAGFGWLLGLGYFVITLRWLVEPFLVDVATHGWMIPFAIGLLCGGFALFWAAAFWAARRLAGGGSAMVWAALTLGLAELLRGHIFTGFPWGLAAYTLIGSPGDVWLAWIGPYGTTVVFLGVAAALAFAVTRAGVWPVAALVVLAAFTFGLHRFTPAAPAATGATVRLVQPNAAQHLKWDPAWMQTFYDRAIAQTTAAAVPDAVIWPETSVPSLLEYATPLIDAIARAARGAPVVAGIQRREAETYYNSAVLIEEPGGVAAIADKAHLVPFGEYVPFSDQLRPLGLGPIVDLMAGFAPGTGTGTMQVEGLGHVRVLICYEGIFPEEISRGPGDPRPDVLVIITNDAWFGQNAGPRQHLVQAQARAIEQGLPVLRAANTGISAIIDARGRIVARLALNEAAYLDGPVPGALPATLYARSVARFGDWPLAVLLCVCILGGAVRRRAIAVDAIAPHG